MRELGIVGILVLAAENEVDAAGESFNGLGRGVHVGGLRIVVEFHAVERGHVLQPVLDRVESFNAAANRFGRGAGQPGRAHRCQHILNVVRTLQMNPRSTA